MVFSADTAHPSEGAPAWYVDPANNVYNEDGSVTFALPKEANKGNGFYFNADKSSVDVTKYEKAVVTLSSSEANTMLRAIVSKSDKLEYDGFELGQKMGIAVGTDDVTFELDLSKAAAGDNGYGVVISHMGWDANTPANPNITVKSIKLVAKK